MKMHKHKGVVGYHNIEQQHKNKAASIAHKTKINSEYGIKANPKLMKALDKNSYPIGLSENINDTPLGTRMRDRVTSFEGIAVAKVIFLNGCVQFSLKPDRLDKDGKTMEANTIDSQQLEVVNEGINKTKKVEEKKPTGGDMPDAPDLSYL